MKIYLIGLPGSGKTTLGRQLADQLMLTFVDLDKEIEKHVGLPVPEIFARSGEDYFRQLESQLLHEWAVVSDGFVMATGGGAPCFYKGIDVINETGLSIFLDVPVKELMTRLRFKGDRPLLQAKDLQEKEEKLMLLRSTRLSCYEKAKLKVHSPNIQKILQVLKFST